MKRGSRGFTIVEIAVAVTVVAILITIAAIGITRIQAQSRDSERQASAQIIAEALEKYYDKHGEYPACSALTAPAENVANNILVGIDLAVLSTPQDSSIDNANSIRCTDLTSSSGPDHFAYVGDGSANCQTGNSCLSFTLKYKVESDNSVASIKSRRSTHINTSGKPVLSAPSITGFTSANLSWTSVPNSTGYTVQWATNSTFTSNLQSREVLGVNTSLTTLSYNTTYYFRVRANASDSVTDWSNVVNGKTRSLAQPTCSVVTNTLTQSTVSWNAISYAASYTLEYATNSSFTSPTSVSTTNTSHTVNGLSPGSTVYYRVRAVNGSYAGSWCTTVSHPVMPATAPTVTYSSVTDTTIQFNWTSVHGAAKYESQYRTNGGAWSSTINEGASTTRTHGPTAPGTLIEIRVRAVNAAGIAGNWSSVVGTHLNVPNPGWNAWGVTESYPSWTLWLYRTGGVSICPSGTSVYSQFRDGVVNSYWNDWRGLGSNGSSSETLRYTSTISNYTSTLQAQFQGYCKNESSGKQSSTVTTGVNTYIHKAPNISLPGPVECAGAYSGRSTYQLRLWLQNVSYNFSANTSVVNWHLYRYSTSSSYHSYDRTKTWPWSVNINGQGWSGQSNSTAFEVGGAGTVETIATGSLTVAHNANGNANIGYSAQDGPGSNIFGQASCSSTYNLADLRP